jgi:hypothetical protein
MLAGTSMDSYSRRLVNDQEIAILKKEIGLKTRIPVFTG